MLTLAMTPFKNAKKKKKRKKIMLVIVTIFLIFILGQGGGFVEHLSMYQPLMAPLSIFIANHHSG